MGRGNISDDSNVNNDVSFRDNKTNVKYLHESLSKLKEIYLFYLLQFLTAYL
jgi:hypothetical protein